MGTNVFVFGAEQHMLIDDDDDDDDDDVYWHWNFSDPAQLVNDGQQFIVPYITTQTQGNLL